MRHVPTSNMKQPGAASARRGFTLVEMVVAALIGVMIAGAVAQSLSQMFRARNSSLAHQQAFARAEGVATRMQLDVQNLMRDADLKFTRLKVTSGGAPGMERDDLMMLVRSMRPIRSESDQGAEGGEYEVQYRIEPATNGDAVWRRVDAAHDDYQDAGGIATPVSLGAFALNVQAYDGNEWLESWDSDADGLPHALRISVTSRSDDGKTKATARRIAAVDRVPITPLADDAATTPAPTDSAATQTPAGTGTAGTGTGTGAGTGTGRTPTGGTGTTPRTGGGGATPRSGGGGTAPPAGGGTPRTGGGGGGGGGGAPTTGGGPPRGGGR